jgi:hypothetical protein
MGARLVELVVMDTEDDPLSAPGSFDYVIGSYSIIFLPDSFAALTRFGKLLVPGGKLAFISPVFSYDTFPFLPELFGQITTDEFLLTYRRGVVAAPDRGALLFMAGGSRDALCDSWRRRIRQCRHP